ncbi:hypothetical protein PINS_up006761 [Pythium insidiosum]|nr:hypothetical protein PINS_up006761 [Pythium insidiosum]
MAQATFVVPLHLQDLELSRSDRVCVHHVHSLDGVSSDEIAQRLRGVNPQGLLSSDGFDFCYSVVKCVIRGSCSVNRGDDAFNIFCPMRTRKIASMGEKVQRQALSTLTAVTSSVTKAIQSSVAARDESNYAMLRSELKATVYLLVMTMAGVSQHRAAAEKAMLKKKKGVSLVNRTESSESFEVLTVCRDI